MGSDDELGESSGRGRGEMPSDGDPIRVLLVDDNAAILRAYERTLAARGMKVVTASNGREASERVTEDAFDVVVSDITMPEMTGLEFLRAVRAHDLDVPVILMTGGPTLDSAIEAVEQGASRYLAKPVDPQALCDAVLHAARLHAMARLKRLALELPGAERTRLGDLAALEVRFSWGLSLLWMAFQPIVAWKSRRVVGYEALLRSDEPLMKNPADMLDAAERLGRLSALGRKIRAKVAEASTSPDLGTAKLFVNLHPADLDDEELYAADAPLSRIADRVVLEITERSSLHSVKHLASSVRRLKALGFQLAVDDLGAGYAGLTSFTHLEPEVAKLDMSLVRGVDVDPRRQHIVEAMTRLCGKLGVVTVLEGVETAAEREALVRLGCDVFQGYLFGRPERGFRAPNWT